MTKKQKAMLDAFYRSDKFSLEECYVRPSYAKEKAYMDCLKKAIEFGSPRYRIVSYNTMQFTFAFTYVNPDDDLLHLHYMTAQNDYDFPIE